MAERIVIIVNTLLNTMITVVIVNVDKINNQIHHIHRSGVVGGGGGGRPLLKYPLNYKSQCYFPYKKLINLRGFTNSQ